MSNYVRPAIRAMTGYIPGEQPRVDAFIKLNTNENPYPPSPRVREALDGLIASDLLRKYPDAVGTSFRDVAGRVLGVAPDSILCGNGSDDILTVITRTFVPEGGLIVAPSPSYLLYQTLAEIQGARYATVPLTKDYKLPAPWPIRQAHVTFVPNPNSPTGTAVTVAELRDLAHHLDGILVIDEAYVDFAGSHALELHHEDNVIVTRTLSKSYCLAGIRFGFGIANPELIRELLKVKDSYNCDMLSVAAAAAALEDQNYLRETTDKILATRDRMQSKLAELGFVTLPSEANFVWCQRDDRPVRPIYDALKQRKILVRYMKYQGFGDGLRISVGTDAEVDQLLAELGRIV